MVFDSKPCRRAAGSHAQGRRRGNEKDEYEEHWKYTKEGEVKLGLRGDIPKIPHNVLIIKGNLDF